MAGKDLTELIDGLPSLIEQLGNALNDLESLEDGSIDKVLMKDIEEHFQKLEASVVNKSLDLEIREKAFKEQESEARVLIASREADVIVKEQKVWDQLQKLKSAAVSAIFEARGVPVEQTDDVEEIEVSNETTDVLTGTDENAELVVFCEGMDAQGLVNYITENLNRKKLSKELALALERASEPVRLVLSSVEFCNKPEESNNHALLEACIVCMEALATLLAKAEAGADDQLLSSPEVTKQAKVIADEWKPKLATDQASLETEAFLQLLASFRIASEFDEEELCKLVLAVAHSRRGPELCRSLGLAHKMPGVIEGLIRDEKQIEAARFIYAFQLTEQFPLVPLLRGYLRDLRRNAQGKGGNMGNVEELQAVKVVVECIDEYKLEEEYPLDPLLRRLAQLKKAVTNETPRRIEKRKIYGVSPAGPPAGQQQKGKKPRSATVTYPNNQTRQVPSVAGLSNNYAYLNTPAYDYQAPSQSTYHQQPYYYPADGGVNANSYAASVPSYSNYAAGGVPTADERSNANPSVPSTYGNFAASGTPAAHQPYM